MNSKSISFHGTPVLLGAASKTVATFGLALALCSVCSLSAAQKSAAAPPSSPAESEAAYTQNIEKRVADIIAVPELKDLAKTGKVHDLLIAQYRALRDWHDVNDPKLKGAAPDVASEIRASLKALHDKFLAGLCAELTPAQVEAVKDKMTYGKVQVTYKAYCDIVPNLTEAQKQKVLELLKQAREEAIDGGSAEEKSAIFKKYKGKINNYLSSEGHNVSQAYKDWGAKEKAKAGSATTPKAEK